MVPGSAPEHPMREHLADVTAVETADARAGAADWTPGGQGTANCGLTFPPRRGVAVPIEIPEVFVLPKGQDFYQFPLFQGAGGNALQYEAFLQSRAFPLKEDVPCRLSMTFTYGDDPSRYVNEQEARDDDRCLLHWIVETRQTMKIWIESELIRRATTRPSAFPALRRRERDGARSHAALQPEPS